MRDSFDDFQRAVDVGSEHFVFYLRNDAFGDFCIFRKVAIDFVRDVAQRTSRQTDIYSADATLVEARTLFETVDNATKSSVCLFDILNYSIANIFDDFIFFDGDNVESAVCRQSADGSDDFGATYLDGCDIFVCCHDRSELLVRGRVVVVVLLLALS